MENAGVSNGLERDIVDKIEQQLYLLSRNPAYKIEAFVGFHRRMGVGLYTTLNGDKIKVELNSLFTSEFNAAGIKQIPPQAVDHRIKRLLFGLLSGRKII